MKVLLLKNRPKKCQEHCLETIFFVCYFIATLGDISLAIRLLLANSSNTVSPPQSSLAQICSVFSRHFQNSIKNSNNREGLGFSPDLIKLNQSRCPYFSCEIKTIHRRKNNVEERLPQEVHNQYLNIDCYPLMYASGSFPLCPTAKVRTSALTQFDQIWTAQYMYYI